MKKVEMIRSFENINKNDVAIAGGKGASLGEMTQVGIPVPSGFVILSNAFERFIRMQLIMTLFYILLDLTDILII